MREDRSGAESVRDGLGVLEACLLLFELRRGVAGLMRARIRLGSESTSDTGEGVVVASLTYANKFGLLWL